MSSTHAEYKGRPIGSKVRGMSIYKISKRILWPLLYSQDNQKVFVSANTRFMINTI